MGTGTPNLLTDESRWLARNMRLLRMIAHRESSSVLAIQTVTENYTVTSDDYTVLVDTSAGDITITLNTPDTGKVYNIKKIDAANTLTIDGDGALIDGSATIDVTALNENTQIQFDGTNYVII